MLAYVKRLTERLDGSARYLPYVYYGLTVLILGALGLRSYTPDDESALGLYLASLLVPVSLVAWTRSRLELQVVDCPPLRHQARRQFLFDFVLYLAIGAGILLSLLLWNPPAAMQAGKLLLGVLIIGYFASMDSALVRERHCHREEAASDDPDVRIVPVARRLGLFLTITIVISLVATSVAAYDYLDRLAANPARSFIDIRQGFALDILTVLILVMGLTLRLVYSYSVNLHFGFTNQTRVLRKVQAGELDTYVPVIGHDEFTVVAQQINKMIDGLREKERVAKTLERIVSPSIMQKLLSADMDTLKLGQEYEVAVLFCDLRDFTSFAEYAPPEEVIYFLNSYFEQMVNIVSDHNGIVNKFMGDAILAIYGLERGSNAVEDAVNTARAIQDHVESLRVQGYSRLETGVGIHRGRAVAGTIGSADRYEYTFIGDVVNTASRLDGLTKRLGCHTIISADVYQGLSGRTRARFTDLGAHRLRGKAEAIHVFGAGTRESGGRATSNTDSRRRRATDRVQEAEHTRA